MKKVWVLVMVLIGSISLVFAGGNNRSIIRIRLSDGSPLMVTINGRDFGKIGRSLTIGDIPGKRQNLQVYKYRRYADGKGGKAELTFSGDIKIQKGSTYDCIVDVVSRKFRMKEVASLAALPAPVPMNRNGMQTLNQGQDAETPAAVQEDDNGDLALPVAVEVRPELLPLKKSMESVDADSKKLSLAVAFINKNKVNTADVTNIANWIFFDDNRMKFVKQAYGSVSDKNNYATVSSVFTLQQSKKEFEDFLKMQ